MARNNQNEYGDRGLVLQPGSKIIETKDGLSSGWAKWHAPSDKAYRLAPEIGSAHPFAKFMKMDKREIVFSAGLAVITGDFAGMDPSKGDESDPVYELSIGTSDEPIETHPDFITEIGGKPSAPLHGAVFINPGTGDITTDDSIGVFEKFSFMDGDEKNKLAGLEAYLDASEIIWRKRYTSQTRPNDIEEVTTIQNPEGPNPSLGKGRTWLYIGLSYTEPGDVFSVTKEWKGSARGGWLEGLYS